MWRHGTMAPRPQVLLAYELQRRYGAQGLQACAVDPGGVRTNIWDHVPVLTVGRWGCKQWKRGAGGGGAAAAAAERHQLVAVALHVT